MPNNHRAIHIIEDTTFIRELLSEIIEQSGYHTHCFKDPSEYIAHTESPDFATPLAVFSDVTMPYMNGYEMISRVKPRMPTTKFVIVTGEVDIRSEYQNLACMYLRKPFFPEAVHTVLNNLSRCHRCGASSDIGCSSVDHRDHFKLEQWSCPEYL
jgi:two-component system response regulator YesN